MRNFIIAIVLLSASSFSFGDEQSRKADRKRPIDKVSEPLMLKDSELQYPCFLCVCSIFKDEAPYFKEWIEYHKLLGVKHFRLYNNDSTDNYLEVLEPYIHQGDVTLVEWPSDPSELGPNEGWVWSTQRPALSDAIAHFSGISKWLAIIDIDEFIVPLEHANLISFLEEYKDYPGVLINWQNFGTSGLRDIPEGKLMIEALTRKAKETSVYNHQVKSIVKPDRVNLDVHGWCPHTWAYLSPQEHLITPSYQKWRFGVVDVSKIRINHYVHRTDRHFYEHKIPNKERMMGEKLKREYIRDWKNSCNQVQDTEIFRFVPELRKRVLIE